MGWWIAAIAWLMAGGYVLLCARRSQRDLKTFQTTEYWRIGDLIAAYKANCTIGNAGTFHQYAQVKGVIRSETPLIAELSEQPCVAYEMAVTEHYDETYDAFGNFRSLSKDLAQSSTAINFYVEDETGRLLVSPTKASLELWEVMNGLTPHSGGPSVQLGRLRFESSQSETRLVKHYHLMERILALDTPVFILGEVTDISGELMIQAPTQANRQFMISHRSPYTIATKQRYDHSNLLYLAIFLIGLSLAFFLIALLQQ